MKITWKEVNLTCKRLGIEGVDRIWYRVNKKGMSIDDAINTPIWGIEHKSNPNSQIAKAGAVGLSASTVRNRIVVLGWSKKDAYSLPANKRGPERIKAAAKKVILREIIMVAKSVPCPDCKGYFPAFNFTVMQFDHVPERGIKKFEIGPILRRPTFPCSPELLKTEIAKCDVVCSNCHDIRTAQRWAQLRAA